MGCREEGLFPTPLVTLVFENRPSDSTQMKHRFPEKKWGHFFTFFSFYYFYFLRDLSFRAKFRQLPPGSKVGSLLHCKRLEELYRFHPSFVSNGSHGHEI